MRYYNFKNTGFSMIELLISMVVASIIIIGVYSFLTSSQRSFTMVQANDGMNRSMQMTNRNITDYLKMAGFRNYHMVVKGATFKEATYDFGSGASDVHFANNSYIAADGTDGSKKHEIFLRYYGSSIDDDLNINDRKFDENKESNRRMFDCAGNFLNRDQLAVIHLYIDDSVTHPGLMCQQIIVDVSTPSNPVAGKVETFLVNPDVRFMMFAFRSDDRSQFFLPFEMDSYSKDVVKNYTTVNSIRYGFIIQQSTYQKATSIKGNTLEYHLLGMDDAKDKVTIPSTDDSTHDMYNLISGLAYAKNRFFE